MKPQQICEGERAVYEESAYKRLWAAAALSALNDCLLPREGRNGKPVPIEYENALADAESFFLKPGRDTYELAFLAGVEPKSFIAEGKRRLALGEDEKHAERKRLLPVE